MFSLFSRGIGQTSICILEIAMSIMINGTKVKTDSEITKKAREGRKEWWNSCCCSWIILSIVLSVITKGNAIYKVHYISSDFWLSCDPPQSSPTYFYSYFQTNQWHLVLIDRDCKWSWTPRGRAVHDKNKNIGPLLKTIITQMYSLQQ